MPIRPGCLAVNIPVVRVSASAGQGQCKTGALGWFRPLEYFPEHFCRPSAQNDRFEKVLAQVVAQAAGHHQGPVVVDLPLAPAAPPPQVCLIRSAQIGPDGARLSLPLHCVSTRRRGIQPHVHQVIVRKVHIIHTRQLAVGLCQQARLKSSQSPPMAFPMTTGPQRRFSVAPSSKSTIGT